MPDQQFERQRSPRREPSMADFLPPDLPGIPNTFATRFDQLRMPVPGRLRYRLLLLVSNLVDRTFITSHLDPDPAAALLEGHFALEAGW